MSETHKLPATAAKSTKMSDDDRSWLADNWHHVNDIGDAEEREEWRDVMRLRRLGIDPGSSQMEILQQLRAHEAQRDRLRNAYIKKT